MAITVNSTTTSKNRPSQQVKVVEVDVDLDNDYPTGGYDVSDQLGDGTVLWSELKAVGDGSTKRWFQINKSTKKLQAFETNGQDVKGSETSSSTDLSSYTGFTLAVIME